MTKEKPTSFTESQRLWMLEALAEARLALEQGDVPVGAVIVKERKIIGRGHNQREARHDPSGHAEIMALRQAGQAIGSWRLTGAEMYVTLEPCPMCTAAIVQAKLFQVVYGLDDPRLGACGSLLNLAQFPGFDHDVAIRSGLMMEESLALLQDFFAAKRKDRVQ
ncbi:MAG: tRNA adenosine(34) deaminase TadA [Clostridiales bacterium]